MAILLLPFLFLLSSSYATDISIYHNRKECQSSSCNPFEALLKLAGNDPARLAYLSSLVAQSSIPIASGQQLTQTANYILRAKLGTPGQVMLMALDTSSDIAWVPCSGCYGCPSTTLFSPSSSSTYATLSCSSPPCTFNQSYGTGSFSALYSQDSLRLALDIIPNYTFGCVNAVTGAESLPKQGLLGLGRGPMSLLSQTGSMYQGVFSYCLPSFKSYYFSGSLKLGPVGQPRSIRTTPLLHNPHRPSLYYVNLTGISVGKTQVLVPAGSLPFDPVTGAGTIVDSGTVITRYVKPVYEALRDEFRRQVGAENYSSLGAFDTCFNDAGAPSVPVVTLHFEGMNLALPAENTLIHSSAMPLACLAMAAAPDNVNAVVNVIANLQQQNLRVLFDVAGSRVGFARELCN
ncbi:putative nepenthesin [Dioscorea sansibarensis]